MTAATPPNRPSKRPTRPIATWPADRLAVDSRLGSMDGKLDVLVGLLKPKG